MNKRKHPSQKRSIQTVQSILETARSILKSDGPLKFNTNSIAKKAGLSVGSVYQYFQSKEKIIETLIEKEVKNALEQFELNVSNLVDLGIEDRVNKLLHQISNLMEESEYLLQAHRLFKLSDDLNLNQIFHQKISHISIPILGEGRLNSSTKKIEDCLIVVREALYPSGPISRQETIPALSTLLIGTLYQ